MGRVAAVAVVGVVLLRLLPGLLQAPDPPPLGADVGLPKAAPVSDVPRERPAARPRKGPRKLRHRRGRGPATKDSPASHAVIGSHRKRRVRKPSNPRHKLEKVVESTPPPVPEYTPPAAPEPVPEHLPEPPPTPPSTPGDGSQEFAPR